MEPSAVGLIVIVALYICIGFMSAAGTVYISTSIFSAKAEQIFFGLFLIPIAGFYLAFTARFGDKGAWPLEVAAVAVFALFGLVGVRVPSALIIGYLLHGLWDAVHEFNAHAGSLSDSRQMTPCRWPTVSFAPHMTFSWRRISTLAAMTGAQPGAGQRQGRRHVKIESRAEMPSSPFERLSGSEGFRLRHRPGYGGVDRPSPRRQGWAESEPGKGATFYFTLG